MKLKFFIFTGFTLISLLGFGQEAKSLTNLVVERIQIQECVNSEAPSCTQDNLEKAILPILKKYLKELPVDTLDLRLGFTVNPEGEMEKSQISMNLRKTTLSGKLKKRLEKVVKQSGPFRVSDYHSGAYPAWHRFEYQYEVLKGENQLLPTKRVDPYNGGVILQIPLFPPCQREGDRKDRECFQKRMQEHIRSNFRYPEPARRQGIQGTVLIKFTIDETGAIKNIATDSPHPQLTAEALRIVSLLPQFQPATENGNPVRVPYSIPIGFKLNTN
jgi:protein TonB